MAQQGINFNWEKLSCSICLDLLKEPVTISCGHSYCMNCINLHWDGEDWKNTYSCPQCRQIFTPRPDLKKNTMLAELVEEVKKTGLQSAPADLCYAGPGDVSCDFCTSKKLKAVKSCLQCLVSYCEQHLQPHYQSPAFEKHNLVDPSKKLQQDLCSHHNEVMKIFCRTDQKCICYLCSFGEHKGHDTVPASAERTERQKEVKPCAEKIRQTIQDRQTDVKVLQQEVEAINQSADTAVKDTDKIFKNLICLIEEKSSVVKQQIRSQQQTKVNRAKNLLQKLQEEITKLRRQDAELEQLSQTKDDCRFLHMFPLISGLSATKWPCPKPRHLQYFEDVTAALSQLYEKLQGFLCEELPKHSRTVTEVDVLLPKPEPTTREEFLQHSCQITLDPNTANMHMILSEENKKATYKRKKQAYPSHPERFMDRSQVLSREALTGRHYWEVEWDGLGIFVAVAYKDISRTGDDSKFGNNDKSWALLCSDGDYELTHKGHGISISAPLSSKVGVYLDYRAGILSFYSVSDSMTLIHRVQTTFTQPLYVGLRAYYFLNVGSSAVLC
ncbi:tripartite motif-containing protein 16-like [Acanthochromis polyacanthus]|uniref:tripartite motif-containing protein 16-like n=1 Tax=Acanthochromis polyacanthus TaxID=80966 RepID=UPI000B8F9877|nr:tripartite motif-containing protein 16-like [Acanthochromis polyacanthus]